MAAGNWHQGVIVFPSGDVVVRAQGVFADTDKTIESVYFSRADVERGFAPHRCGVRRYLKLYFLGIDATAAVITICETDLRDDVTRIADFINEMKVRVRVGGYWCGVGWLGGWVGGWVGGGGGRGAWPRTRHATLRSHPPRAQAKSMSSY